MFRLSIGGKKINNHCKNNVDIQRLKLHVVNKHLTKISFTYSIKVLFINVITTFSMKTFLHGNFTLAITKETIYETKHFQ
jgi:hypothetical protein